jgi:hypothetical protein
VRTEGSVFTFTTTDRAPRLVRVVVSTPLRVGSTVKLVFDQAIDISGWSANPTVLFNGSASGAPGCCHHLADSAVLSRRHQLHLQRHCVLHRDLV